MNRSVLTWSSPTRLDVPAELIERAHKLLSVIDKSADFKLAKLQRQRSWKRDQMGKEAYDQEVAKLQERRIRCLLKKDDRGAWAPSGLRDFLAERLGAEVVRTFEPPEPRPLPWRRTPQEHFGRDPFQHQAEAAPLLAGQPGPVTGELPCGTGKSLLLALILRNLGLQAAVVLSSKVLADQLLALLMILLGPRHVGEFNGDTKQVGKLITVCSAMAVKNLRPGDAAYRHLAGCDVLLGDESHTFAADVLESLAMGLFAAAAYRAFVTATKIRADGLVLVLLGVVGPTVAEMTFRQAVERRLLAEPSFTTISVESKVAYFSRDSDRMTRAHLFENPDVADLASDLAKYFKRQGYSCLFLVEEFPQAAALLQRVPGAAVLHGGTGSFEVQIDFHDDLELEPLIASPGRRLNTSCGQMSAESLLEKWLLGGPIEIDLLPVEGDGAPLRIVKVGRCSESGQELLPADQRDRAPAELQELFNDGSLWDLIATSAGRVGVDLRPPRKMVVFYLVGGTSEVSLVQGMGRGTRPQGKDHFLFVDFRIDALARHYEVRAEILQRLWARPQEMTEREIRLALGQQKEKDHGA